LYTAEEWAAIEHLTKDLEATYQPRGAAETQFLRDIAIQFQRQQRLDAYTQLLADRANSEAQSDRLSLRYPSPYDGAFATGTSPKDEIRTLNDIKAKANKFPTDQWRDVSIAYAENFVSVDFGVAADKSPLLRAIARHATGNAPVAEVVQAIDDRLTEVNARQQQYQAERDRQKLMDAEIKAYEAMAAPNVDVIQSSINRQIKVAIGNLKELQMLRLNMAAGAVSVNAGISKARKAAG
jgi:hypothetical protein